ncbi:MAG: hypothetical protein VKI83_05720 [Synechococcaceae cyanobacterium]|nr:hypothetical protein [Synechococcaceae cyanobacterium]
MGHLLEILLAMVISAIVASSITSLAMVPVKSQKQSSNYAAAEGMAIRIRKYIVDQSKTDSGATPVFVNDDDMLDAGKYSAALSVGAGKTCQIKKDYAPPGLLSLIPYAVECRIGTGSTYAQAWQPAYTSARLTEKPGAPSAIDLATCIGTKMNKGQPRLSLGSLTLDCGANLGKITFNVIGEGNGDCEKADKLKIQEIKMNDNGILEQKCD